MLQILADNLDDSWLYHLRGTARLIQLRGPSQHLSGFGQSLLLTQIILIVRSFPSSFPPLFHLTS
jgi:hypothetical protein